MSDAPDRPTISADPDAASGSGPRRGLPSAVLISFVMASGDGLAFVALAVRVYATSHSGWAVSVVFLAMSAPVAVLAPVAGVILDRLPVRTTLTATAAWVAAVAMALSLASSLPATLGLAAGFGVGAGLLQPGLGTLVPRLVDATSITKANGYLQAATWSGLTVGPLLAGALSAAGGTALALQVDAVAYGVGVVVLGFLPLRGVDHAGQDAAERLTTKLRAGIGFLRAQPDLGVLVAVVGVMIAFVNLATVAEVVFAEGVLHAGPGGYAALVATWTAAMVGGTLLAGRLPASGLGVAALVGTTCTGIGIAAAGLAGNLWQAMIPYGFGGLANGVEVVAVRSLLNHRVPAWLSGRVFALYSGLVFAASSLGTGLAGALLVPLGGRRVLIAAGAGGIVAGLAGSTVRWRRRLSGESLG